MTDLKILLDVAAGEARPASPQEVEALVVRGRRALRRRRVAGTAGGLTAALALLGTVPLAHGVLGDRQPSERATVQVAAQAPENVDVPVPLVPSADRFRPDAPFAVTLQPQGWVLDRADKRAYTFDLSYAPPGFREDPDREHVGKLVVLLASMDQKSLNQGSPVTVNGRPGVLRTPDATYEREFGLSVEWVLADGRIAVVQTPRSLHWDSSTLLRFASTVRVGATAEAGVG